MKSFGYKKDASFNVHFHKDCFTNADLSRGLNTTKEAGIYEEPGSH